ncbi:MAG: hypothetical protein H6836_07225 [Planctomycetes bacterium]|nr:hypothetical protein [Planctomycetota bacterium]MCB9889354.1 hypothetical protein [Planctomycetota bacterium]
MQAHTFVRSLVCASLFATVAPCQQVVSIDVNPSGDSTPNYFVNANGTLYFSATHPTSGRELWKSDGTQAGTKLAVDIEPGPGSSNPIYSMATGRTLFCTATTSAAGTELVAVDLSTDTATVLDLMPGATSSNPGIIVFFQGRAYFAATGAAGRELWCSDGTTAGTYQVADLAPGSASSDPNYFCEYRGKLYFQATTPANGTELFVTDGTTAGTTLALELQAGSASSNPAFMTVFRGEIVFQADTPTQGLELISWDGTTARVFDIATGTASSGPRPGRSNNYPPGHGLRFAANASVLYMRASTPATGVELFKFDGTTASLVRDIRPGTTGSECYDIEFFGDEVIFTANDGPSGLEPWMSSGTAATTRRIADLATGAGGSNSENYTPLGSRRMIFESKVTGAGEELVITDGTNSTLIDLWPGATSSFAAELLPIDGRVFFNGQHPTIGYELHVLDTGAMAIPFGNGCASSAPHPVLGGTDPVLSGSASIAFEQALPNSPALVCVGRRAPSSTLIDFGSGCYVYLDFTKPVIFHGATTDAQGRWSQGFAVGSSPSTLGISLGVQVAVPNATAFPPLGVDLSNLLMMTIGN